MEKAYSFYQTLFSKGVNVDLFVKQFSKTTGYLIDEAGEVKTLSGLVKNLVKQFDSCEGKLNSQILFLQYSESQMMAHANGYMAFANNGAWSDIYATALSPEFLLLNFLKKEYAIVQASKNENGSLTDKARSNSLREEIKNLSDIIKKKQLLLQQPVSYLK